MARPRNTEAPAGTDSTNWDETAEAEPTVKVRCIVDTRPHTGGHDPEDPKTLLGLYKDQEVEIPASVAKAMLAKKQVEKVE